MAVIKINDMKRILVTYMKDETMPSPHPDYTRVVYVGALEGTAGTFFHPDVYRAKIFDAELEANCFIETLEFPPQTKQEIEIALDNNKITRATKEAVTDMAEKLTRYIEVSTYPPEPTAALIKEK